MPDTERVKPRSLYVEEAIALALESRWQDALTTNIALVDRHGADEDTFNRIGKAQTELGNLQAALEAYTHALELNPLNLIAQKNTRKIAVMLESSLPVPKTTAAIDVDVFTEEPGKSALTVLVAPKKAVGVTVAPGDVVELDQVDGKLEARTVRGVLLGDVDLKLSRRLIGLMETGNEYTAAVARVADDHIEIMIRESMQSSANSGKPSFPVTRTSRSGAEFRPYAKESLRAQRGIDAESMDAADVDDIEDVDATDTAGMQTTEDFDDEAAVVGAVDDDEDDEDDAPVDDDDDSRPEDHY